MPSTHMSLFSTRGPRDHRAPAAPALRPRWGWVIGGFLAALAVGVLYASLVRASGDWNTGLPWERALMLRVDTRLPHAIDALMLTVPWTATNLTLAPLIILAAAWLHFRTRRSDIAVYLLVVQFGCFALNFLLKFAFARERPALWAKRGQFAFASYPSGHAISTTALLVTIAVILHRERGWLWPYWIVAAISITTLWSRLYLGVHWPTDVIAGGVVGLVWLAATLVAFGRRGAGNGEPGTGTATHQSR